LGDVFFNLFLSHPDTGIGDGQGLGFFIEADFYFAFFDRVFEFAHPRECAEFFGGVHRVAHQFTKENFLVGVQEFFNNRENVL